MTLRQYFGKAEPPETIQTNLNSLGQMSQLSSSARDCEEYVEIVKKNIDAGSLKVIGNPIVIPSCPFAEAAELNRVRNDTGKELLTEADVVMLVKRQEIFAWVPEKIFPGVRIICPS